MLFNMQNSNTISGLAVTNVALNNPCGIPDKRSTLQPSVVCPWCLQYVMEKANTVVVVLRFFYC